MAKAAGEPRSRHDVTRAGQLLRRQSASGAVGFLRGLLADAGHPPVVVPGEAGNWKVTTETDLRRAVEALRG